MEAIVLKVQQDELGYKLWLDHGMGIFSHKTIRTQIIKLHRQLNGVY